MPFRVAQLPEDEPDKTPRVLQGPADQVSSRQLRPRAVRMGHLAPDVREALVQGGVESGLNSNGRFWKVGDLLVCTHRLTDLSGGEEEWTYPHEFSAAPRVTATPVTALARTATVQLITATAAEIRAWTDSGGTSNVDVDVVAIGLTT